MNKDMTVPPQPYVGPRPFETQDRHLFFGREREAYEISALVLANRFFVLYAASGAGKTSLFNAGIHPLIEGELDILPTVRFQARVPYGNLNIANVYTYAALSRWASPRDPDNIARISLADFLAIRPKRQIQTIGISVPRLLVFDQFEELFTTHPDRWQQRREFLEQLAEASDSDPDLKVLVIMREDFLSRLLNLADSLFSGLKDRYFLEPLRKSAAELAVTGPAHGTGRSFEPDAVNDLVRRLMTTRVDIGDERIVHIEGEFVEPVLLQVVCQALWTALPADVSTITRAHVRDLADVDTCLARFYSDAVQDATTQSGVPERQIREWVEQKLLTHPGGTRGTVYVGARMTEGLPNEAVKLLEGKLLRAEFRSGARWLEITHDSLLAPIEQSNIDFFRTLDKPVARLADELAIEIGRVWQSETVIRRLNDPYPLPIRWDAADPDLLDTWDELTRVATSGIGWPRPSSGMWASGPSELSGEGSQLVHLLERIPTGRLLVLGEPGSGKTMLMVRLVLDQLARRRSGDRVPVLLSMASWDPASQDLRSWLVNRLSTDYPILAGKVQSGVPRENGIEALLANRLIMPILDGLDEIPDAARGIAISKINDGLRPGEGVVVTSRTSAYWTSVRPVRDMNVTLRAAAGVELRPLDSSEVAQYLKVDAGPIAAARWDPVLANLLDDTPVRHVLTTPLMVSLARVIYNPRPSELQGAIPDPAELLSPNLANPEALQEVLFDGFIPAVYRYGTDYGPRSRWTAQRAQLWLTFLARHLEFDIGRPDLAWWELDKALPRQMLTVASAVIGVLVGGVMFGLAGVLAGGLRGALVGGSAGGLLLGLLLGLGLWAERRPAGGINWNLRRAISVGIPLGLTAGLVAGLVNGGTFGWEFGLVFGLVLSSAVGLAAGIKVTPKIFAEPASPSIVLRRDRRTALVVGLTSGLIWGAVFAMIFGLVFGRPAGITFGFAGGLAAAITISCYVSAWPKWQLTRAFLSLRHQLPWRCMAFLNDAHWRGVLRQAGSMYQFRHVQLQHRLARMVSGGTGRT